MQTPDAPPPAITLSDIERATEIAAELVRRYGEAYWPFFVRMEREFEERRTRQERLIRFTGEKSN